MLSGKRSSETSAPVSTISYSWATIAVSMGAGFALENPEPGGNPVSLFCLPEVRALAEWRGI
eukprot:7268034-Alexandrium_andersonii.AAC.1